MDFSIYESNFNDSDLQSEVEPKELEQCGSNSEVNSTFPKDSGFPPGFEKFSARQEFVEELAAMEREIELQDQRDAVESADAAEAEAVAVAAHVAAETAAQAAAVLEAVLAEIGDPGPETVPARAARSDRPMSPPPPTVRKSARLQGKSPVKTYSTKRKKGNKVRDEAEPSIKAKLAVSDLVRSIEAEILHSNPMSEDLAAVVGAYCGAGSKPIESVAIPSGGMGEGQNDQSVQIRTGMEGEGAGHMMEEGDSVLHGINLYSDDDLTDVDEDAV